MPGRILFCQVGCERWFCWVEVENVKRGKGSVISRTWREVLPVRVSGSNGHESSRGTEGGTAGNLLGYCVTVVEDRGSGLRENRPGLNRLPAMVSDGGVTVVRVTRPARFGVGWLRRLFAVHAVVLEVPHPKKSGGRDELRENFGSLVAAFAGWLCDLRSARAREWLLAETGWRSEDGAV
jgi:predicted site-specific integrase-resolvase